MMSNYKKPYIAQLEVTDFPKNFTSKDYGYVITAKGEGFKTYTSKYLYFNKNKTIKINVINKNVKVQVDIFKNGNEWQGGAILKHFPSDSENSYNTYSLKSTEAKAKQSENNIKETYLSQGLEVGWLLIKKKETVDSLLKRIYIKPPTTREYSIFRNNNAHIQNLNEKNVNTVLQPCQIVIISNKYGNYPALNEYKKLAFSIEEKIKKLKMMDTFDPEFFAQNYELLFDYWEQANEMILANEIPVDKVAEFKKSYCDPDKEDSALEQVEDKAGGAMGYVEAKDNGNRKLKADEIKVLKEESIKKAKKIADEIDKAYKIELKNNSPLARPVNSKKFRQKYIKLFNQLDEIAKNDFQAIKKVNYSPALKNFLKNDILLRDEAFKGGLKMYDKMIMDLGKVSAGLKDAKRMVIGLGIAVGAVEVLDAYGTGDKELGTKVLLAESAKFAGGLLGGALAGAGAVLIVGSTGGTAIVVIAVASYYGGKYVGDGAKDLVAKKVGIC